MPDKMSIAELSAAIKKREPRLAGIPDDELVRKVLERRPELMSMINTSEPRPEMKDKTALYDRIKKSFYPGGTVNDFSRLWTPGVKGVAPSPQDDPFYRQAIGKLLDPDPERPKPPGIEYAQDLAKKFKDIQTLAATLGAKNP